MPVDKLTVSALEVLRDRKGLDFQGQVVRHFDRFLCPLEHEAQRSHPLIGSPKKIAAWYPKSCGGTG
jgi:hypothetical protein